MLNLDSYSYAIVRPLWRIVHLAVWCSGISVVGSALPLGFLSSMMCLGLRLRLPLSLHKGRLILMHCDSPPAVPFADFNIDPDVQGGGAQTALQTEVK